MSAGHCYLKALSHSPSIYTEYYRLNWSHSFEHTSSYATEMNDVSSLSSENELGRDLRSFSYRFTDYTERSVCIASQQGALYFSLNLSADLADLLPLFTATRHPFSNTFP